MMRGHTTEYPVCKSMVRCGIQPRPILVGVWQVPTLRAGRVPSSREDMFGMLPRAPGGGGVDDGEEEWTGDKTTPGLIEQGQSPIGKRGHGGVFWIKVGGLQSEMQGLFGPFTSHSGHPYDGGWRSRPSIQLVLGRIDGLDDTVPQARMHIYLVQHA
jgi:hypothetical protein